MLTDDARQTALGYMYLIDSSELHVNYMAIFGPPPQKKDTEVIVLNTII